MAGAAVDGKAGIFDARELRACSASNVLCGPGQSRDAYDPICSIARGRLRVARAASGRAMPRPSVEAAVLDRLRGMRKPNESYNSVILHLVALRQGAGALPGSVQAQALLGMR